MNPIVHHPGPATFAGRRISAQALKEGYNCVAHQGFGTTRVAPPGGPGYDVRDLLYPPDPGRVGMTILGVRDRTAACAADGHGSEEIDAFLRRASGLGPGDPIYALLCHVWAKDHACDLSWILGNPFKLQTGHLHMGVYLGEGRTSHAPEGYHGRTWGVWKNGGYPANLSIVSLEGVDQATLNRNAVLVDACLNRGVVFPADHLYARCRAIDLNTALMFYRDWLRGAAYLRTDDTWATYCSEHKTIVVNVMLNLPHNLASFEEVFGAEEGGDVFGLFKKSFAELNGREFAAADETRFVPLWKLEGLDAAAIRAFSKPEYDAYEKARREGRLRDFKGRRPVGAPRGTAWAPETTVDLLKCFLETYAPFPRVLGLTTSAMIYGFRDEVVRRMRIPVERYLTLVFPMIRKVMHADAKLRAAPDFRRYRAVAWAALYRIFGGTDEELLDLEGPSEALSRDDLRLEDAELSNLHPRFLAELAMMDVDDHEDEIVRAGRQPMAVVHRWLKSALQPDVERARRQAVDPSETTVQFYYSAAIGNRVAVGLYATGQVNRYVSVRHVCTAVDAGQLESAEPRADAAEPAATIAHAADATAGEILEDLAGPAYFELPAVLTRFLAGRLGPGESGGTAARLAREILADLEGPGSLRERSALAAFLDGNDLRDG